MLMVPIQTIGHTNDVLIIILEDENLERMAKADPAEIKLKDSGKELVNPVVYVCHEKVTQELITILKTRDLSLIMGHLQRGFEFRPDKGDHDNGPVRSFRAAITPVPSGRHD